MEMMTLRTPIISILIGEGGSGGALALAVADEVWMMENAIYSVISPEGCASILWKDSSKVKEAADCLKLTADDMLRFDVVERLIPEKDREFEAIYTELQNLLLEKLKEKSILPIEELLNQRYQRFRKFGM